jgi:multidrug resistance protein
MISQNMHEAPASISGPPLLEHKSTTANQTQKITEEKWPSPGILDSQSSPQLSLFTGEDVEKNSVDGSIEQKDDDNNAEMNDEQPAILYLTFATELPVPHTDSLSTEQISNLPPAPDLTKWRDPLTWSPRKKLLVVILSSIVTLLTAECAGLYSPGSAFMEAEWNVSHTVILIGIPAFTTGFAIAPMVLAPFSEINGRKPVVIITGILFIICQVCCGVSRSYGGFIAARFFQGVGGSTFSTMVGGIISDIYTTRERNTPMALFSMGAIFGTGLGPLLSGFIAQNLHWRWMFYVQAIMDAAIIIPFLCYFDETRGSVLLSRRAKALNAWYEKLEAAGCPGLAFPSGSTSSSTNEPKSSVVGLRWKVAADEERGTLMNMLRVSLTRPFHLLFTEPILFSFALWVTFSWMILYLSLAAVPLVYTSLEYHFSIQNSAAFFASLMIAAIVFTPICIYQEKYAYRKNWLGYRDRSHTPEHRLVFVSFQSLLLPIGLFIFGWTARPSIHPAVSAFGLMLASMGIFSIYLAVFNYLADTYGLYASSALAAQSFCRNMAGGAIPLFTGAMYHKLGVGPACSLLGGLGLLLGLVPSVLLAWGPKIRGRSPFAVGGKQ